MEAAAVASRRAQGLGLSRLSFVLPPGAAKDPALVEGAAQGAKLGTYSFDRFKEKSPNGRARLGSFTLAASEAPASAAESARTGQVIGDAVAFVRDLSTLPSNYKTPTMIAKQAKRMARETGLSCRVLGKAEMGRLGMEAVLGVASSAEPPAFIILEHKPRRARPGAPSSSSGRDHLRHGRDLHQTRR